MSSSLIIGLGGAYIELLENHPCNSKEELLKREGELIRQMRDVCVNKVIAGRSKQEYESDNIEKLKQYRKEYRNKHKKENAEYQKNYRESHQQEKAKYGKTYRESHVDQMKQYMGTYYENNAEEIKQKRNQSLS